MKAYVLIKIRTSEVPEALSQMRAARGVLSAEMTFGPFDAIAVIEGADLSALGRIVVAGIQPCVGVESTLTCLAVEGV